MTPRPLTAVATALAAATLLLLGSLPAQAQSSDTRTTYKVVPYVISDPALVEHPDKLVEEVKEHGDLDRLGIKPATENGPSRITGAKAARTKAAAQATPAGYVVDSSRFPRGSVPADIFDYATRDQCDDNSEAASADAGWIKNRYSYCQKHVLFMPAFECGIFPPRCRLSGTYASTNTLIGYGKTSGYESNPASSRWADFRLSVDNILTTGVFSGSGADLEASIECEGNYLDDDFPETDENACFPGLNNETEKSINEWRRDSGAHFDVISQASEPDISHGAQIGTGVFHIEYEFDLPWYFQALDTESPEGGMRFDSAVYLGPGNSRMGSVFDRAVPGMAYRLGDAAVAGVAQHIDDARTDPDSTVPPRAFKNLVGATPVAPLHRLPGSRLMPAQRARVIDNRNVSTGFCGTIGMPPQPPTGGPFDCDEYPFASTYEGAARFKYEPADQQAQFRDQFSVRWVNRTVNREAGARLGRWYGVDRILDHEEFFLPIQP
ncbi:hypothetical protein SRB5_00400 [Streptomyces sp. RB5]|uniref:Deoxyribonuclease NucA/NucB domain-containing protein n=1 Tax=Streptomyces smaragdinus TaxID=2585196 RepID=A0A7K0C911_9ACTN|nr:hypothetical protein [Streptomyces smaragdinus]MQY09937.1 hypothetical protein [Streptomyces smaragdinus]